MLRKNVIKAKYGIDDMGWWIRRVLLPMELTVGNLFLAGLERFKFLVYFEVKDDSRV